MTKTMYDCAWLPKPTPQGYDVAAGYIYNGGGAANIWTQDDWWRAESQSRYLLPIATVWRPFGNPVADADNAIADWVMFFPHSEGCAIALDVEAGIAQAAHNAGYIDTWRARIRSRGYHDIVYSSRSTAHLLGQGSKWIAFGDLVGDVSIVQNQFLGSIDTNIARDDVPFYDTKPAVVVVEDEDMIIMSSNRGAYLVCEGSVIKLVDIPSVGAVEAVGVKNARVSDAQIDALSHLASK